MTTKKDSKLIESKLSELLSQIGVDGEVSIKELGEGIYEAFIDTKDAGLLIGSRGKSLYSLQHILSLIVRQLGIEAVITIDVAGWRKKETERLERLADQVAERVVTSGEPQPIYNLSASQRRVVHLYLSTNSKVKTESQGDGRDRFLFVLPK